MTPIPYCLTVIRLVIIMVLQSGMPIALGATHFVHFNDDLQAVIDGLNPDDVLAVFPGAYPIQDALRINKPLTILAAQTNAPVNIIGNLTLSGTGNWTLQNITLCSNLNVTGSGSWYFQNVDLTPKAGQFISRVRPLV